MLISAGCDRQPESANPTGPDSSVDFKAVEAALGAADSYFNTGDLDKARVILARLVEREPREMRARELYGQTLALLARQSLQVGDAGESERLNLEAYEQYKIAISIEPESAGLQHSAGMIALGAKQMEEALGHFLEAGRLDPLNPQSPLFAAQILILNRHLDQAEAELERARRLDEDEPMIQASLAIIALERKEFDLARRRIARARTIDPHNLDLLVQEARIHRRSGDPMRALEMLVLLDGIQRARLAVSEEMALSYEAIGQSQKAAEVWTHRIRVHRNAEGREVPVIWRDAVKAAEAFLRAGQREEAWHWLQNARNQMPGAEEVIALEARFADS